MTRARRGRSWLGCAWLLAACAAPAPIELDASTPPDAPLLDDAARPPVDAAPSDAGGARAGRAPSGVLGRELAAADGANPLLVGPSAPALVRVDVAPGEHVTFVLTFEGAGGGIELEVLRWDGARGVALGKTNAGPGLRTLAVLDASGPRTFWARVTSHARTLDATLAVHREPFADAPRCVGDCAHLLQLPLPNDPRRDGYAMSPSTVYRYQHGRRDLLMTIRRAARRLAALGLPPLLVDDLSQWDGRTPGDDVGAPRHASHQRGEDVDLALYGTDGRAAFRSHCVVVRTERGRECVPGTLSGYDALANALLLTELLRDPPGAHAFLDRELIEATLAGAHRASALGLIDDSAPSRLAPALQHWPSQDDHLHLRITPAPADPTRALTRDGCEHP